MQNLAGHEHATYLAQTELELVGVPVVPVDDRHNEVPTQVAGDLNGFTFRRCWRYWAVRGRMPLEVAQRLYEDPIGRRDVRVAGHCGCPAPEEWAEWFAPDGTELLADPDGVQAKKFASLKAAHPTLGDGQRFRFVPDPSKVPGARAYVTLYHVDSGAGLRLLVEAIRELTSEHLPLSIAS